MDKHLFQSILYRLERLHGRPGSIYRQDSSSVDRTSGAKTVSHTRYEIPNIIKLPRKTHLEHIKHLTDYKTSDAEFIINRAYLPDFTLITTDYIIRDNHRYNIVLYKEYDNDGAYYIHARETQRDQPYVVRQYNMVQVRRGIATVEVS